MLKRVILYTGKRGMLWLAIANISGVALGVVEVFSSFLLTKLFSLVGIGGMDLSLPRAFRFIETLSVSSFIFLMLLLGALRSFLKVGMQFGAAACKQHISLRLRTACYHNYLLNPSCNLSQSQLIFQLGDVISGFTNFIFSVTGALPVVLQISVLFVSLLFTEATKSLVGIAILAVLSVSLLGIKRKLRVISNKLPQIQLKYQETTVRVTRNKLFLKIVRMTDFEFKNLVTHSIELIQNNIRTVWLSSVTGNLPEFYGSLLVTGLILFQLKAPTSSGVQFFSFIYLFLRFVQLTAGLIGMIPGILNTLPFFKMGLTTFSSYGGDSFTAGQSAEKQVSFSFSSKEQMIAKEKPVKSDSRVPPEIKIEGLTFRYSQQDKPIVEDFSVSVNAGSILGLRGRSGTGKSTFLSLVLGMASFEKGSIFLGGVASERFLQNPENKVGYVGPDPFLILGSVRENLNYAAERKFSDAELLEHLVAVDLIDSGDGALSRNKILDIAITESGEGLSTGQKQRICLARALLGKPNLLVLDEASANIDSETELKIAEVVSKVRGKSTILIVSHREAMLKNADQIIDFPVSK